MASSEPPAPRARPATRITERDRALLAFTAEHHFVLPAQIGALLGVTAKTAAGRLSALRDAGHLRSDRTYAHRPVAYQITADGLRVAGSDLSRPAGLHDATYDHDAGLVWLMLHARAGRFGALRAIVSERRMRSADARAALEPGALGAPGADAAESFGVRLGGSGPGGRPRLHYPDLLLVTASGHRAALELELTVKHRPRLETILAGYAADRRIDAVVYLVDRAATARAVTRCAGRVGAGELVSVQRMGWSGPRPSQAAAQSAAAAHAARAARRVGRGATAGRTGSPAARSAARPAGRTGSPAAGTAARPAGRER